MNEVQIFFAFVIPVSVLLLGVPIALVPLAWARALRWRVPQTEFSKDERNLSLYFARCLGAVAIAFGVACGAAGIRNEVPAVLVLQAIFVGAGLTLAHVHGALRRAQPMSETVEIVGYAGFTLWAISIHLRFY